MQLSNTNKIKKFLIIFMKRVTTLNSFPSFFFNQFLFLKKCKMSKFSLKYIVLLFFLLQLLFEVKSQAPFKPSSDRFDHTATLIDNKFYILGGFDLSGTSG